MLALNKHKRMLPIPMRLIALTALFAIILSAVTAYFKKDQLEMQLLQQARQALLAADLPPVAIAFEGRAAQLSGPLADDYLVDDVVRTVSNVAGVRAVTHELEQAASEEAELRLALFEPEFENGLYIPPRFHPLEKYSLDAVQFAYATADLMPPALPVLDRLATLLQANAGIQVELSVHVDNQGTVLGQMALTELRANTLRRYMLAQGVLPEQLLTTGYGATRPIASNATLQGKQRNRRVEISVLQDG